MKVADASRYAAGALAALLLAFPLAARQQRRRTAPTPDSATQSFPGETTRDYNARIQQLVGRSGIAGLPLPLGNYQIGPEDLLRISVMEAPDLGRTVRVAEDGEISLPLLGSVRVAGLTSRQLETVLESLLGRRYMKSPHVSVFVEEVRSHPVSVFGAVEKPGVFQIRQGKTLIELLSMAEGLAPDAGDTVVVMRQAGDAGIGAAVAPPPADSAQTTRPSASAAADLGPQAATADLEGGASVTISLKELLDSGDPRYNVLVYPGDVVKVTRAGIVYVVGQVNKPGGFLLKTNENISVLQALALAEGLSPTAAGKKARIIEPGATLGSGKQVSVNLDKILKGKAPDFMLQSQDILFVPNSRGKSVFHGLVSSMGGIATAVSGAAVYRY